MDIEQQVTLNPVLHNPNKYSFTSIIYVKCTERQRLSMWDNIYHLTNSMDFPWLMDGDVNVILNEKQNLIGLTALP